MKIELTDHQDDFLNDQHKFALLRGGVGSGKTFIGSHYVIRKTIEDPKTMGLIAANTYKQLRNSTLACLFNELDAANIAFNHNQHTGILNINGTRILCTSLDNYNALRGVEIGWFWLDEVRDAKLEAFEVVMGRLRCKKAKQLQGRLTSTPAGFDWGHDYFSGDKKTNDFELIEATSHDNPYLPDGYIDTLESSYDSKMYQQEVLGKVININQGAIYYAFDRTKHAVKTERSKDSPIWIGMDFNVNPMAAVITNLAGVTVSVFDETYLMTSNTDETACTIKEKYGAGHRVVPDATGKALKTSAAGLSDHIILENAGFRVMRTSNPFRVDRYNCVNNMLEKGLIKINPTCKNLIRDLEQVSYKEGTSHPDTTKDKTLTHVSDALGYLCWYMNPLVKHNKPQMIPR